MNTTENINGKATHTQKTFNMQYVVTTNINAKATDIWAILTNASNFPKWNSTIKSIKGKIALGEKIKLIAHIAPERTFKIKISKFTPAQKMVWSGGMAPMFKGVRIFTLTEKPDGSTDFNMSEVFTGVMLPMIKKSLPDFRPVFEQYASDLKTEAEKNN
jgi:hypothetical protein